MTSLDLESLDLGLDFGESTWVDSPVEPVNSCPSSVLSANHFTPKTIAPTMISVSSNFEKGVSRLAILCLVSLLKEEFSFT
jgi:hypothetical protein